MTTDSSQNVYIYEQGQSRGHFGMYQPGDKFEVVLNRENKIQYWVNDEIRYTSKLSPSFPLYVGASMYQIGSQLHSVQWEGYRTDAIKPKEAGKPIQFTNYQHTTSDKKGDLRVSTTRTSYNNGAFSYYGIEKSDNIKGIEFVIGRHNVLTMVALSDSQYNRVNNGYSDMMYTFMFHSNNHVYIYEKGTHRATPTTYGAGDKFEIRIRNDGKVEYVKNDGVIYTSSKYAQYPLYMDVELYNTQSSVKNARWLAK